MGNQLRGAALSSSTLTRVQDATLRVWVTDIVSVVFGKDGKRSIIAMAPADSTARSIAQRLVKFAASQSAVATPTTSRDIVRAASIGGLAAMVQQATTSGFNTRVDRAENRSGASQELAAPAGRIEGRVKFYNGERQFGFIVDRSSKEYFFNSNHFRGAAPLAGAIVEFDPVQGSKGIGARNVVVI